MIGRRQPAPTTGAGISARLLALAVDGATALDHLMGCQAHDHLSSLNRHDRDALHELADIYALLAQEALVRLDDPRITGV